MKKGIIFIYSGIFVGICVFLFFALKSFELIYFHEKYYKVPDLKSYTFEEAEKIVDKTDLKVRKMGKEFSSYPIGEIFLQEPEPGSIVKEGRNIRVWVSQGTALVDVPNLNGMNYLDAKVLAESKGLIIDKVVTVNGVGKYNEVLATDPNTNTLLTKGEKISFLVNGQENVVQVKVPDIVGLPVAEGTDILFKNSLILGNTSYMSIPNIEKDVILKTSISAGSKVAAGSTIDIVVNR